MRIEEIRNELLRTSKAFTADYPHTAEVVAELLRETDIALELLRGCLGDGGSISFPLYEGIEKFVERHRA